MSNVKMLTAKLVKTVAENALSKDANRTTCTIFYQPPMPKALKQFKNKKV